MFNNLKKGWFVIVIITVTFALLGFFASWTFCKNPVGKDEVRNKVINFKYKVNLDIDIKDFTSEDTKKKINELTVSYYTGSKLTTYGYVDTSTLTAKKVEDYYQIKIAVSAFDNDKITNKELTAKGFLKNLTLIVADNYIDHNEYPDHPSASDSSKTIKGVTDLFDEDFFKEKSLDQDGNLITEFIEGQPAKGMSKNSQIILITSLSGVFGIIVGFTVVLILGYKFSDKLEKNKEIFDNETVFRTPFHKAYWIQASNEFKNVRKMVIMALLLALTLVSKLIVLPSGFGTLGFKFGLIFLSVAAMIGGPLWALVIGASSDILGYFLFESGSGEFNFMFTLSAMLACFVYALCFYRTNISFTKCLIARLFVNFVCNFIIEGTGQMITRGYTYKWLIFTSLPKQVAYLIPQSIIIFIVLITVAPIAADTNFVDEKIKKGISLF